jgi:hypothetical protein
MALVDEGLSHLGRRQVGVATRRLELGVGVGVGLDDGADVGGQLRVLVFATLSAASGEVLQAADPVMAFLQSLLDGLASPSEASLGLAGVGGAEFDGDLGLEGAALVAGKATGP